MTDISSQSSSRLVEQSLLNKNGLNIIKRGLVTIKSSDFSSTGYAQKSTDIYTYYNALGGTPAFLIQSFDVYHFFQDPDNELTSEDVDQGIIKLPYTDYTAGTVLKNAYAILGYDTFSGGLGGAGGVTVKLYISCFMGLASGSPFAKDTDQTFYYIVYSQDPGSGIPEIN